MPNSITQVDALENCGIELRSGGFSHPDCGVRQGFYFGWTGSASRSSGGAPVLAARFQLVEEQRTIQAAATTDTTNTSLLPINSIIHGVCGRVTTVIPTAATFNVGDATIAARFASGVAVAATTTFVGTLMWDATGTSGQRQTANAAVRVTPNLTPGAATGVVALQVFSETFLPPTA